METGRVISSWGHSHFLFRFEIEKKKRDDVQSRHSKMISYERKREPKKKEE